MVSPATRWGFLAWVLLLACPRESSPKVVKGRIAAAPDLFHPSDPNAADKLHFLGKFCYGNTDGGYGALRVKTVSKQEGVHILLLDDDKWQALWSKRASLSCARVLQIAQGMETWQTTIPAGPFDVSTSIFDIVRPHYWYAAAINCDNALDFSFSITFTNPGGSPLSYDQQGTFWLYVMFGLVTSALLIFFWRFHSVSIGGGFASLLTIGLALAVWSALCKLLYIGSEASVTASKSTIWEGAGDLFDFWGDIAHMLCDCTLSLTLLLSAHGYGVDVLVTSQSFRQAVAVSILIFGCHVMLLITSWWYSDPASDASPYKSPAGYLHVLSLLVGGALCLQGTWRLSNACEDPRRRAFVYAVGGVGAAWFVAVPFVVIIVHALVSPWLRAFVVACTRCVADAIFFGLAVWIMFPGSASAFIRKEKSLRELIDRGSGGVGYENI